MTEDTEEFNRRRTCPFCGAQATAIETHVGNPVLYPFNRWEKRQDGNGHTWWIPSPLAPPAAPKPPALPRDPNPAIPDPAQGWDPSNYYPY